MNLELEGRRALVTGSHRGTGEIIARRLAAEGARVIVHGFEPGQAETVAHTIDGARAVTGNLMDDAGAESVWQEARCRTGRRWMLANDYGRAGRRQLHHLLERGAGRGMYEENVLSAARLIRLALPALRAAGHGRIINLGTIGSTRPAARNPHYYAAKGALATLPPPPLAQEVAGAGITVSPVSPGIIHTPEVEQWLTERGRQKGWGETWAEIEARAVAENFPNPLGRLARREEVADLVCFLAGERAGLVRGQNIRIDGGCEPIVRRLIRGQLA
ncbi:MAG: SDR family oxidoreductase [Gammaproteobacteria bacterium]|nr:SDR family oxidoreductase [Gammaproteobacteria bacterium]